MDTTSDIPAETPESYRKEIISLKEQLRKLREEREHWFSQKRALGQKIVELINQVRTRRKERNSLTDGVKDNKEKRRELNKLIRDKIAAIKELNQKKQTMQKDHGSDVDPVKLQKEIDHLMYRVETEGMSFTNEQKIMKTIHEKKKLLDQFKGSSDVFKDMRTLSKEIDDLKKEADKFHEMVQNQASDSQKQHEEMISISAQIDALKAEEKKAQDAYLKAKEEFNTANRRLREIMKTMQASDKKEAAEYAEQEEHASARRKESIKEKAADVAEKIKNKKTLTTEDLMIMQQAHGDDLDLKL